jgi:hypothetical protein
LLSIV